MAWWNWQDEEPNEYACGRISSDAWAENDCNEAIKYICQRGKQTVLLCQNGSNLICIKFLKSTCIQINF